MMMMILWKRVVTNQLLLSTALPPLALSFTVKSHKTFFNFCTQISAQSTTPPRRGVVTEFILNKCGLSEEEITKAFRHHSKYLNAKSSQNLEEVLELVNGYGLNTPPQIRRVVLCNPKFLFSKAKRNIQPKLTLLGTFMEKEDIRKLLSNNTRLFGTRKDKLESAFSLLQRLGFEGQALSKLVAAQPHLLTTSEEKTIESFKRAEDLGLEKGSKMFALTVHHILGVAKETIDRRLRIMSSSGFSDKQILGLAPWILGSTEEKLKRNLEFVVNTVGLTLDDIAKYPYLLGYSLEKRIIPRYRAMEALKSMQLLKTKMRFTQFVKLPARHFLQEYVISNADSSSVLSDIYHDAKAGKLISDKEACNKRVSVKKIHKDCERPPAPSR